MVARNEDELREILEAIWRNPEKDAVILAEAAARNRDLYEFERMLSNYTSTAKPIYVNCWKSPTAHSILCDLVSFLRQFVHRREHVKELC